VAEGTFESVATGPGEVTETATEDDVDGIGAGRLGSTAGLIGDAVAVDGLAEELKSWVGTGAGVSAGVVDGMAVELESWAGTGTDAGAVLGFAPEEESRPGSKLPPGGGEAGSAWRSAVFICFNTSLCVSPKLCVWERSRLAPADTVRVTSPGFQ
jgi:hypothetical protein